MRLDASGRLLVGTTTSSGNIATFKGSQQSFIIRNGVDSDYNEFGVWDGASDGLKAVIKAEGGLGKFGTRTNSSMVFQTNDTERARIDTSGNLGIGTSSPAAKLNVSSTGNGYRALFDDTTNDNTLGIYSDSTNTRLVSLNNARGSYKQLGFQSNVMVFSASNGSESARIDTSGNLLVGTTTGSDRLVVNGSAAIAGGRGTSYSLKFADWLLYNTSSGGNFTFSNYTTELITLTQNGDLLVGTTSKLSGGVDGLDINTAGESGITFAKSGTVKNYFYLNTDALSFRWQTASGVTADVISNTNGVTLTNGATSWASLSDERKKDIIEPITDAATKVSSLRAVIGKYKTEEDGIRRAMLIAQDVQAVLPEAVVENKDGELLLQYTDTIPLLVAAIKEQQAIIESLKARLDAANL
jgi:hypothetical protein